MFLVQKINVSGNLTDRRNPCLKIPCDKNPCRKNHCQKDSCEKNTCEKNHCQNKIPANKNHCRKKYLQKNTCRNKIPADGKHCSIVPSELIKNMFQCLVFGPTLSPLSLELRFIVFFQKRSRLTSTFVYKVDSTHSINISIGVM